MSCLRASLKFATTAFSVPPTASPSKPSGRFCQSITPQSLPHPHGWMKTSPPTLLPPWAVPVVPTAAGSCNCPNPCSPSEGTPMNHGLIPSRLNSRSPAGKKLQPSRHGRFLSLSCPSQSKLGSRPLPNPSEPSTSAFPKPRIAFLGPLTQFAPQHFT